MWSHCLKSLSGIARAKVLLSKHSVRLPVMEYQKGPGSCPGLQLLPWAALPAHQAVEVVSLLRGSCGQGVMWRAFCFEFTPLFGLSQLRFINLWTYFSKREKGRKALEGFWGTTEELSKPAFRSEWMFIKGRQAVYSTFSTLITSNNYCQNAFSEHLLVLMRWWGRDAEWIASVWKKAQRKPSKN